jgi:hypothetical protein
VGDDQGQGGAVMLQPKPFEDYCEEMARGGDGSFAIACAIFRLADEVKEVGGALNAIDDTFDRGLVQTLIYKLDRIADAIDAPS